ncbi:MAG: prepilin-type N-terminal cleavage/methylation domain-containing protein [bacterium]
MRANRERGMTLLEALVAMGVFALVMMATFPLVDQTMSRFQMSRDHYVAATICQARIERARGVPYADLPLLAESGAQVDDYGNLSVPGGRFRRTTTVVTNTPVAGMTMLTMETQICLCTRWGWRKHLHPLRQGKMVCQFTDEKEEMAFLFTEYKK